MAIGPKKLLQLVKTKKLVENLSERELTNPEGAGFDLRLSEVFRISGKGFLGVDERQTPNIKSVAKFSDKRKNKIVVKPNDYFLVKTIESVNLPVEIGGYLYTRGTLFRSGVVLILSQNTIGTAGSERHIRRYCHDPVLPLFSYYSSNSNGIHVRCSRHQ